jgi:CRP-like cAMP-binding protein
MGNRILEKGPLFEGLNDEEFEGMLQLFERRKYPPLSSIFLENMPGQTLYLLERGLVKIAKIRGEFDVDTDDDGSEVPPGALAVGVERVLVHIRPGEFFGEMSFVDGLSRSASAFAVEESELLVLDKASFDNMARSNPVLALKLALNVARILSNRLRKTDQLLVGLTDVLYTCRT